MTQLHNRHHGSDDVSTSGSDDRPEVDSSPPNGGEAEKGVSLIIPSTENYHDYPEGGFQAWTVAFGAWAGMFACFGQMNTIGTFQAYISENQLKDYSPSAIGWIFSTYVFLAFFCGVQIGPIFDAKGPRLLVLAGSCFTVASLMLLGNCTSMSQVNADPRSRTLC